MTVQCKSPVSGDRATRLNLTVSFLEEPGPCSAVEKCCHGRVVTRSRRDAFRYERSDSIQLLRGEFDLDRTGIFLEPLRAAGARDGNHVVVTGEQPRESKLCRSAPFGRGNRP